MNIYSTIIRRVYGEYTITRFLGNFGACANIGYQAAFPPPLHGLGMRLVHVHVSFSVQYRSVNGPSKQFPLVISGLAVISNLQAEVYQYMAVLD